MMLPVWLAACLAVAVATTAPSLKGSKPNIVFLLLDDVGWADFAFNGNPVQETPRIEALASAGMVLTDVYSASPLCSPSRAAALTGRLPIRNGFYTDTWFGRNGYAGQGVSGALPDTEVLLQEALQTGAGYVTGMYGKNHLGCRPNASYVPRGWNEWAGTCDVHFRFGGGSGLPNLAFMANGTMLGRLYETPPYALNTANHTGNLTEYYTDYAVDFIHRHAGEPFFLFWTPDSTHGPTFSAPQFVGTSRRGPYGASLAEIDYNVGRIMDALVEEGLDQGQTFVFLTSDNGAATYDFSSAGPNGGTNGPLLCGKETTFGTGACPRCGS